MTETRLNPDDRIAREAIATALGMKPYIVQGDSVAIDKRLAKIWPDEARHILRMLVYHQDSPIADEVEAYAQYLDDLLNGQLDYFQTEAKTEPNLDDLAKTASCGHNLVIFGEPGQARLKRLLLGPAGCQVVERVSTSMLIARQPRWPLKKILLVTRGHEEDNVAVEWLIRLARPSNAAVTVLALVPVMPKMYQQAMTYMPWGLADWLTTDTPLGQQLRQIANRLTNWKIEGKLRFRQGSLERQIKSEVDEGDCDLIVVAADPSDWWLRRLLGEVINPLLRWADRPVLIAKPTIL